MENHQKNSGQNIYSKGEEARWLSPSSDTELPARWGQYFADLLNSDSESLPSDLPPPADQDPPFCIDSPALGETQKAIQYMNSNKRSDLDCVITAEGLQGAARWWPTSYTDVVLKYISKSHNPPDQWITDFIVPLPKKGYLSLMTKNTGITLMSIATRCTTRYCCHLFVSTLFPYKQYIKIQNNKNVMEE